MPIHLMLVLNPELKVPYSTFAVLLPPNPQQLSLGPSAHLHPNPVLIKVFQHRKENQSAALRILYEPYGVAAYCNQAQ